MGDIAEVNKTLPENIKNLNMLTGEGLLAYSEMFGDIPITGIYERDVTYSYFCHKPEGDPDALAIFRTYDRILGTDEINYILNIPDMVKAKRMRYILQVQMLSIVLGEILIITGGTDGHGSTLGMLPLLRVPPENWFNVFRRHVVPYLIKHDIIKRYIEISESDKEVVRNIYNGDRKWIQ
jgi:hypothetical protein